MMDIRLIEPSSQMSHNPSCHNTTSRVSHLGNGLPIMSVKCTGVIFSSLLFSILNKKEENKGGHIMPDLVKLSTSDGVTQLQEKYLHSWFRVDGSCRKAHGVFNGVSLLRYVYTNLGIRSQLLKDHGTLFFWMRAWRSPLSEEIIRHNWSKSQCFQVQPNECCDLLIFLYQFEVFSQIFFLR